MKTEVDYQVIIIGGGIGGLALASICRKVGLTYRVLERASSVKPAGAAISLAPNALKVLDQIGLYTEIQRVAQPITKIQVSRNETRWNTLDWTICKDVYGYPVYSIERPELIRILYEGAGGLETVELNASVQDIIDNAEEPFVRVKMADGSELTAATVVGADGIRSLTRRVLSRKQGNEGANTIKFTGRVHMSGITYPMKNLGPQELGVANWLFYDNSVLMTYGCIDNRQWFIGIKVCPAKFEKALSCCRKLTIL
jgi:salicylate hydroxylase